MANFYELKPEKVRRTCPIEALPFETTEELKPLEEIIGQERAVRAMEFGLKIQKEGYNIFMVGPAGTGKATYARRIAKQVAETEPVPDDWCYVYNFDYPDQPLALSFPVGKGKIFAKRMQKLLENLLIEIPRAFESEEYECKKNEILSQYQTAKKRLMKELEEFAQKKGFIVQEKQNSILTIPEIDGRFLSTEEFEALSEVEKEKLKLASEEIEKKAKEIFRRGRKMERKFKDRLEALDRETGSIIVDQLFREIMKLYKNNPDVINYLNAYKNDVIESLDEFRSQEETVELPIFNEEDGDFSFLRYQVNLFIDNSNLKGAPVIYEINPTYYRLMGKVEYVSRMGALYTSFMQIKPGALHQANGGYLILSVRDLLLNSESWHALKRALKTKEIQIENLGEGYGVISVASLRPTAIPLRVKIILLGNPDLYYLLLNFDEDFRKLFKIKVDFERTMERNEENIMKMARFIRTYGERANLLPFHSSAVAEVVDYSSRLAGDQEKLSTYFNLLIEVISEAETWAKLEGAVLVTGDHVKKAIKEKVNRNNRYEELILKMIKEGTLMIECYGCRIGQVNALVILDFGDYTFGYPSKVTAVVYRGQKGVIHIERETKMSGAIHDKGLMILTNFLGSRYAQEHPLNLSASLTFEQVYSGIDGDSASCAELIALLSGIAQIPVYQNIAITGSVNQKGEIQPVGGVTQKVEGFFKTCKAGGLPEIRG
ncbi:Lon protease family protein [Anoxybacter fermentans]|uniref:Lon protease family protein n=1 Tax=Anoxybacter fermentans TaxID=1323375 RepID=UPI000F8C5690|nr:ATP-binding protein [Anoxybacter fermentans]